MESIESSKVTKWDLCYENHPSTFSDRAYSDKLRPTYRFLLA
ncbi:7505_t:CDS:2, partial [Cetraspora pellucida]